MRKALLLSGIILVLASSLIMACSRESICGEYRAFLWSSPTEYVIVLEEGGNFHYKVRTFRERDILEELISEEWIDGEWIIKESGEWDRQGDNLYFHIDDSIIEATIDDGEIIVGTIDYAKGILGENSKIPYGKWLKVE